MRTVFIYKATFGITLPVIDIVQSSPLLQRSAVYDDVKSEMQDNDDLLLKH